MKGYKTYLIIGSILILLYLVAQYNKPTPTNWAPTYAVKDKVAVNNIGSQQKSNVIPGTTYGYLVNYSSFEDSKFLAALLNAGIRVRFTEKDFSINGKKFSSGTLIVLKKGNEDKMDEFATAAKQFDASVTAISSGFMEAGADFGSGKVHFIDKPTVAMLTGKTVSPNSA